MPLYEYQCSACEYYFTDLMNIASRLDPETKPCPECKKKKVKFLISAPMICDPVRIGVTRPSSEFNDVLTRIHERTHGSNLDQKLSRHVPKKRGI